MELKPQERPVKLFPVGVRYICEFCNEGEMKFDRSQPVGIPEPGMMPTMFPHVCEKCGKAMLLPKMYPYVDWVKKEEYDRIFNEND